ncbi:hypothetical protein QWZ06_19600 [Chryseobacterium tructae]|uniref:Uncharacterized protein n=1 Tax=Chryseobacterium tructae TaxID=1037380 RepID=A0ABV7Y0I3_9FLAO|nr:hypothetical protein [Chryseobacterium tructae]MDN3694329.1 hypothetical protein [Chryseobacterium tructae]
MANFDIAIGISQNALNQITSAFYDLGKNTIFKGSIDASGITVNWQANTAPVINLNPPSLDKAQQIVESCDLNKYPRLLSIVSPETKNHVAEFLADSGNGFSLKIDEFQMTFGDDPVTVPLYARGSVTTNGSQTSLNILSIAITVQGSVNQNIVNKFIIPEMMNVLGGALKGVSIPPLSLPNINLGGSRAAIKNGQLLVFANISSNPSVPSIDGFGFPSNDFFAVLSNNTMQQEVNASVAGKTFGPSGSVDLGITHADYHATVTIQNPKVSISGTDLHINMDLKGSAGASITIACSHPGIDFNVYATPSPTVTCRTSIDNNNNISVHGSSCSSFASIVNVTGWVPPIVSEFVDLIASAIASTVTATLSSQIVGAISFGSFQLPQIGVNYGGVNLNISGTGMNMGNIQGCMTIQGGISIAYRAEPAQVY